MSKRMGGVLLLLAGSVMAAPLQMNDFAYGIPLQVDGDGAIYSLPLPAEVYRRTVRSDLGDLRVFNGLGEEVPHLLQREPAQQLAPRRIKAKLYPLPTQENQPAGEELHIAIGGEGPLIDYYSGRLPLPGAGAGEYYLLDASDAEAPVERLHLEWDEGVEPLLAEVSLDGSDDLSHWQPLLQKRTIASLSQQGFQLRQSNLELPAQRVKYYRLHWPPGSRGIALRRVEMELRPAYQPLPGESIRVEPTAGAGGDGEYEFTLDGHFPISAVQLVMPQRNSVVYARLFSRAESAQPWQRRHQGLFYDLEREGHRLRNEPLKLSPLSHPQWRLEVEQEGGGLGRGLPQLEVSWHPQRLLFVARGEMPFTLAFGRQQTESQGVAIDPLLRRITDDGSRGGMIKSAAAGERFELGGEMRLRPPVPPLPWKKWLLWALLLGGVGVLAVMARTLWYQLRGSETR
ncbi:MAG: DUF3999 domain-containing protein [Gammaproteobacteria bacterium]|nr:DUF3999 domain-containing protein [Gammaproteobacteria bacterium]